MKCTQTFKTTLVIYNWHFIWNRHLINVSPFCFVVKIIFNVVKTLALFSDMKGCIHKVADTPIHIQGDDRFKHIPLCLKNILIWFRSISDKKYPSDSTLKQIHFIFGQKIDCIFISFHTIERIEFVSVRIINVPSAGRGLTQALVPHHYTLHCSILWCCTPGVHCDYVQLAYTDFVYPVYTHFLCIRNVHCDFVCPVYPYWSFGCTLKLV